MYIKDMFERDIKRDIQGVIKVGQEHEDNIHNELDEYVVTKELEKHFRDFFTAYQKGVTKHTDKMGVWISGFFGSGKSHFLKILSYILENKEVKGRKAIDYFLVDNKIQDNFTKGLIEMAASVPTDIILFNIDSKSDSSGIKNKDSILNVFLKVFNEMQGYSTNPHLAHLERSLDKKGLYSQFKERYQELHGESWVETRHAFNFYKTKVEETLVDIGFMSLEDARYWSESTIQDFEMSIENFALLVKEYIDTKADNHHVVFLVDEVGQYVGDDTDLMLNLQTITEDLGRICQGKSWVIVTSQQDIDSMTKVKGNDFSKIQGRFDTRLSLTSANVDEVIKLRILKKNEVAEETLKIEYSQKETIMKNLIIFNDTVEKKGYETVTDFVEIYPFIPYQSDILAYVLTSIRRHGASGKHLSEGERSMLALYKQSAETIKDSEIGSIVPFNLFYDALEKFLDHSHASVIKKALESNIINPSKEKDNFNINVLKTLFMIKYVDEIELNIDNITTLMVSHIDEDRLLLKENVHRALKILEGQMLIQRHGEYYIFLTDEEQEINREIQKQNVEDVEINRAIQENIFGSIFLENKVTIDKVVYKNRYNFDFDKILDEVPYKTTRNADLKVHIITPRNGIHNDIQSLSALSLQDSGAVIINMQEDRELIDEIITSLKIEKFLNQSHGKNLPNIDDIDRKKRQELRETKNRIEFLIDNNLKSARFFVNNNEIKPISSDFKTNVMSILAEVANEIYNKLTYVSAPKDIEDIQKLLARKEESKTLYEDEIPNKLAVQEVLDYIKRTSHRSTITLKSILEQFKKQPYGYTDSDIQWLVTYLYVEGAIALVYSGERLSLYKQPIEVHMNYLTKTSYSDRLVVEIKESMPENYKQSIRLVARELFSRPLTTSDNDEMVRIFKEDTEQLRRQIEHLRNTSSEDYPGYSILEELWKVLKTIQEANSTRDVMTYVHNNKNNLLELADDYDQVRIFFTQGQKTYWDTAIKNRDTFSSEKDFLETSELNLIIEELSHILEMPHPYGRLRELPDLNHQFNEEYFKQLEHKKDPLYISLEDSKKSILTDAKKDLDNISEFNEKINTIFKELEDDIKFSKSIRDLNSIEIQIDIKSNQAYQELNTIIQKEIMPELKDGSVKDLDVQSKVPIKTTSMKQTLGQNQVRLETKEDIEMFIRMIRKEFEKELEEADRIIIKL